MLGLSFDLTFWGASIMMFYLIQPCYRKFGLCMEVFQKGNQSLSFYWDLSASDNNVGNKGLQMRDS